MKTLDQLFKTLPQQGTVTWIGVRPERRAEMLIVDALSHSSAVEWLRGIGWLLRVSLGASDLFLQTLVRRRKSTSAWFVPTGLSVRCLLCRFIRVSSSSAPVQCRVVDWSGLLASPSGFASHNLLTNSALALHRNHPPTVLDR